MQVIEGDEERKGKCAISYIGCGGRRKQSNEEQYCEEGCWKLTRGSSPCKLRWRQRCDELVEKKLLLAR